MSLVLLIFEEEKGKKNHGRGKKKKEGGEKKKKEWDRCCFALAFGRVTVGGEKGGGGKGGKARGFSLVPNGARFEAPTQAKGGEKKKRGMETPILTLLNELRPVWGGKAL